MQSADESKKEMTTIAVSKETAKELKDLEKGSDDYEAVIRKLLAGVTDVYVEFISIDNDFPRLHEAIIKMGVEADNFYFWDGIIFRPVSKWDVGDRWRRPKPNMTITREEAEAIKKAITKCEATEPLSFLYERIKIFLEQRPVQ